MVPNCEYKRCESLGEEVIGELLHPATLDGFGNTWKQEVRLCPKHAHKIRRLLNIRQPEEDDD